MPSLVPTLLHRLARADGLLASGRPAQAREAFEALLEAAQDAGDRALEVVARSTLARMALRQHAVDEARALLAAAGRVLDPNHLPGHLRYREALVRLAIEESPPSVARDEIRRYLAWAESQELGAAVIDATLLLADFTSGAERVELLERGIDRAEALEATSRLGEACLRLGATLEPDAPEAALEAYEQARGWLERHGTRRDVVGVAWAIGHTAARVEDWGRARDALDGARRLAEGADDCDDLLTWLLADLAMVEATAGDVVEGRRLMVRARALGATHQLPSLWPDRWADVERRARALDL